MRLVKYAMLMTTIAASMMCQSCGGANNTNGTLVITAPASVAAGSPLPVSAAYSNADATSLQGLSVSFTSSSPSVSSGTKSTDGSGTAATQLATTNNISADQTVVVTAHAGGLTQSATVILKANKLTIGTPGTFAGTFPATTTGIIIPVGTFISYTDGNGAPISGAQIAISVISLVPPQGTNQANVFWSYSSGSTPPGPFILSQPVTGTTNSSGIIDLSYFTVSSLVPAAGQSTPVRAEFQAVATVVPGVTITQSASYTFTFTGQ